MTLAFLFIFPLIFKRIKLPGYEAYTASNIFQQASLLTKWIFSFGREAVTEYQNSERETPSLDELSPPPNEPDEPLEL